MPQVASNSIQSVEILGVRIHAVSMKDALDQVHNFIHTGGKHQIVTVNPEFIMEAQQNHAFRSVINSSSLAIPDGIGVLIGAKLFGQSIRERVTGVELVENYAAIAAKSDVSIFFLGAAPGVAERASNKLLKRYPKLRISGTYSGSPCPSEDATITEIINKSNPDLLLVAYGAPNQDLWISRNLGKLNVKVAIGVGGTFDFLSGIVTRAPRAVRMVGLEWLYRLIQEPNRWKRQLSLPKFVFQCLKRRF